MCLTSSPSIAGSEKYVGEWKKDVIDGVGRYSFASGSSYEGAFVQSKFEG